MYESLIDEFINKIRYLASTLKYKNNTIIEEKDLINSGVVGLLKANDRFDKSKNIKFSTFAEFHIKGSMLDELRSARFHSRGAGERISKIKKAYIFLEKCFNRKIEQEEVAKFLNIKMDKFYENINVTNVTNFNDLIIDSKFESIDIMESIPGNEISLELKITYKEIHELISKLSKKEQVIIHLYFYYDYSMKEIAKFFNITESAISLRIKKIIKELQENILGIKPEIKKKIIKRKKKIKKKHKPSIEYIQAKEVKRGKIINCIVCKKEFIKKHSVQVFCSKSGIGNCKDKYWTKNR